MDMDKFLKLEWLEPKKRPKPDPYKERYATFNERILASAIDMFLSAIVLMPFTAMSRAFIYQGIDPKAQIDAFAAERFGENYNQPFTWEDFNAFSLYIMQSGLWEKMDAGQSAPAFVAGYYFCIFLASLFFYTWNDGISFAGGR